MFLGGLEFLVADDRHNILAYTAGGGAFGVVLNHSGEEATLLTPWVGATMRLSTVGPEGVA